MLGITGLGNDEGWVFEIRMQGESRHEHVCYLQSYVCLRMKDREGEKKRRPQAEKKGKNESQSRRHIGRDKIVVEMAGCSNEGARKVTAFGDLLVALVQSS